MNSIQKYIFEQLEKKELSKQDAAAYLKELKQMETSNVEEIAIIGIACRLPMANNADEYWDNLIQGRNCFSAKPQEKMLIEDVYRNKHYANYSEQELVTDENEDLENYIAPFITDIDKFDAAFFGIPPREAKYIDPIQRVFLENCWTSLEDAGYSADNIRDTKTGVFVGKDGMNSINYRYITVPDSTKTSGTWEGILASRINYLYNLKGPSMVIDTACSSGLVATHEACNALRNGDCDIAIAGGISMLGGCAKTEDSDFDVIDNFKMEEQEGATVKSKDNRIRAFDKKGSGTVFGEGIVSYVLKPLKNAIKDKDHIYAIIKGSAINNDGTSNGITSPNPVAQEEVIIDAWKNARVQPESVSYIETHGTGTVLGDPIEIMGITNAFSKFTKKKQFCGVGSVKTNIGHIIGASGCANLLKVILSMNHHELPPTIYFEEPNPLINFINSPVYVVDKKQDWIGGEEPLRAGISAFGFSGTNCHMVIEEFKEDGKQEKQTGKTNIFTISAKSITAMEQFVKNYNEFFKDKEDMNLEEICYTAITGRGHYTYRAAIVVDSFKNLKNKLKQLAENGLNTAASQGIFYGMNRVVSDRSLSKAEGEITESELYHITAEVNQMVLQLKEKPFDECKNELIDLCASYVKGANVDWARLYSGKKIRKLSIPTYPFDRISCWGDTKLLQEEDLLINTAAARVHPLVDKCIVESMKESIYRVTFNLKNQWILQEHKIKGVNLVSGTTYIEICKEVLRQYYKSDNIVIEDLVFLKSLVVKLEDGDVEAQIIVEKNDSKDKFSVVSKRFDEDGNVYWLEHLQGLAHKHDDQPGSISRMEEYKEKAETSEEFFFESPQGGSDGETKFGARWKCVKSISKGNDELGEFICTELLLPPELAGDLKDGYRYHPGMLDDAINTGLQSYSGLQLYLPFSYKNMKIYKNLPKHFFSILRVKPRKENAEIIGGQVILADIDGNMLAEIEECTIKKVNNFNEYVSNSYYIPKWILCKAEESRKVIPEGNILILGKNALQEKLISKISIDTNKIYFVTFGPEYKKENERNYIVSGTEGDYERLFADINQNNFSTVYHLATTGSVYTDEEYSVYKEEINEGLLSTFFLSKIMTRNNYRDVHFVLVTENANEVDGKETGIKPANAAFIALTKTTVAEFIGFSYRCIDVDHKTDLEMIVSEMLQDTVSPLKVAYRDNKRYREVLTSLKLDNNGKRIVEVKNDGVYIITGGTGGLGLEVALNLARLNSCNLCLIARKKLPDRAEWEAIIKAGENLKQCNLLKNILYIESLGCEITIIPCDVSDYNKMNEIIVELKMKYGKINGVVHCAGIAGDGFLISKPLETFQNVISPKVFGTVVLDEVTKDQKLDFFIMFSSIQSLLGGPGQGDYTAANAFMDSYAALLRKRGVKAHAINWPGWKETGMAFDYNIADGLSVFKTLATQTAISSLNDIICYDLSNVVPSELDYEYIAKNSSDDNLYWISLSDDLKRKLVHYQKVSSNDKVSERKIISVDELILLGKGEDEYTETEKIVGYIYAAVLNMSEIDIYENFASMGGNSILATELLKVLNHEFDNILNITDMFTYASVEELSAFIDSKKLETEEEKEVKETYDNLIDKFEAGDVLIESMINYFDDSNE